MDLGPLLDAAVDQMAKDPDWLLNFVLTTMFRVESIPESRMKPLKERYLSQQRQIHAEPPSSPLQTTVDDSHKSDDGMPTLSDHVRHVDDGFEDLAVPSPLEEDDFGNALRLKTPNRWEGLCYRIDENLTEGRINADILEMYGLDSAEEDNGYINLCICLGNSKCEKIHRLQVWPAEYFSRANIIFGKDMSRTRRTSAKPGIIEDGPSGLMHGQREKYSSSSKHVDPGIIGNGPSRLMHGQREKHSSPGKHVDQMGGFEPDLRPLVHYDKGSTPYHVPEEILKLVKDITEQFSGSPAERGTFLATTIQQLLPHYSPQHATPRGDPPEPRNHRYQKKGQLAAGGQCG